MATNYEIWSPRLPEASRRALSTIYGAWRAGQPTERGRLMFLLVRAGMVARDAEAWIKTACEGDEPLLKLAGHYSALERLAHALDDGAPESTLVPTLAATLALAANADTRADLDDLERLVAYLHAGCDADRKDVPVAEMAAALGLEPASLLRLVELTGLTRHDATVTTGIEPLYWTSFEEFLARRIKRPEPRVAPVTRLPIAASFEEVEWAGLGPFRDDTTLRLTPMTLLVGANGVGKTTALVALSWLHGLAERGLAAIDDVAQRFAADVLVTTIAATATLTRPGAAATETIMWGMSPGRAPGWVSRVEILRRIEPVASVAEDAELATMVLGTGRWRDQAGRLVEHTMRPDELALTTADSPAAQWHLMALRQSLLRWHVDVATVARWQLHDDNDWPFDQLSIDYLGDAARTDELRRHVHAVTGFADFEPSMLDRPRKGGHSFGRNPRLESAGVMRAIEILAWLFAPEPPTLLAIDELENHLHADLAARLIDVMRGVSSRTQIVVTTHSARVLRCFAPAEVRLIRRGASGSTIVAVDDDPRLKRLAEAGDLADLIQDGYFAGGV